MKTNRRSRSLTGSNVVCKKEMFSDAALSLSLSLSVSQVEFKSVKKGYDETLSPSLDEFSVIPPPSSWSACRKITRRHYQHTSCWRMSGTSTISSRLSAFNSPTVLTCKVSTSSGSFFLLIAITVSPTKTLWDQIVLFFDMTHIRTLRCRRLKDTPLSLPRGWLATYLPLKRRQHESIA